MLAAVRPAVVCLYAESSGWGRAALAACRAAHVPAVAVQHGIVYRELLLVRARPRRGGLPAPRAHRRLRRGGAAPPPRDGPLPGPRAGHDGQPQARPAPGVGAHVGRGGDARGAGRARGRAAGGGGQPVSRHPAHPSVDRERAARTLRALEALGVRTVIKPHPAEGEEDYARVLREAGATRARVSRGRRPPAPPARRGRPGDRRVAGRGGGAGARAAGGRPQRAHQPPRDGGGGGGAGRARGRRTHGRRCAARSSTRTRARPCARRARATARRSPTGTTAGPPRASSPSCAGRRACPSRAARRPREAMVG